MTKTPSLFRYVCWFFCFYTFLLLLICCYIEWLVQKREISKIVTLVFNNDNVGFNIFNFLCVVLFCFEIAFSKCAFCLDVFLFFVMNVDDFTVRLFLSSLVFFFCTKLLNCRMTCVIYEHINTLKSIFSDVNASRSLIEFFPLELKPIPSNVYVYICVIIINWNHIKLRIAKSSNSPCATKLQRFTVFFSL